VELFEMFLKVLEAVTLREMVGEGLVNRFV